MVEPITRCRRSSFGLTVEDCRRLGEGPVLLLLDHYRGAHAGVPPLRRKEVVRG